MSRPREARESKGDRDVVPHIASREESIQLGDHQSVTWPAGGKRAG